MWFVINTDLTITTEKITELLSTMKDDYVDDVGICLGLPQSKTDDIKSNYHSAAQRRDAYIDAFVNDHPCPQWRYVSKVLHEVGLRHEVVGLHHQAVGLRHQADVVYSTYVQGTIKLHSGH